jgi:hypothetical protein
MSSTIVTIATPYLTVSEFARQTGLSRRAVLERCKKGQLPVKERYVRGGKYLINNALLIKQALEANF